MGIPISALSNKKKSQVKLSDAIRTIALIVKPMARSAYDPDVHLRQRDDVLSISLNDANHVVQVSIDVMPIGKSDFDVIVTLDTLLKYVNKEPTDVNVTEDAMTLYFSSRRNKTTIKLQNNIPFDQVHEDSEHVIRVLPNNIVHAFNKIHSSVDKNAIPILVTHADDINVYAITADIDREQGDSANTIVMSKVGTCSNDEEFVCVPMNVPAFVAMNKLALTVGYVYLDFHFGETMCWEELSYGSHGHKGFVSLQLVDPNTNAVNNSIELAKYIYEQSVIDDNIIFEAKFKDALKFASPIDEIKQTNTVNLHFTDVIIDFNNHTLSSESVLGERVVREFTDFEVKKETEMTEQARFQTPQNLLRMIQDGELVFRVCLHEETGACWIYLQQDTTVVFSFVNIISGEEIDDE